MNNNNIKYYKKGNRQYAEWGDRSLDDEDRYAEDSILITVYVPIIKDNLEQTIKNVKTKLVNSYDKWIKKTRR